MALYLKIDLNQYIKRIKQQQKSLSKSILFSDFEKTKVNNCYEELLAICKQRLQDEKDFQDKVNEIVVYNS